MGWEPDRPVGNHWEISSVTEMATLGDLPLANQESLRFEGEQELRRSAIVWHWRALGAPGPDHWDTQPGPSSMPGMAKLIQLLMWCMQFLDAKVEPGCVGKLIRLSTGLPGPNFDLGPHFSSLILSLSTFSFSMHFFAFSDTEI